jgi:hypothetical protein
MAQLAHSDASHLGRLGLARGSTSQPGLLARSTRLLGEHAWARKDLVAEAESSGQLASCFGRLARSVSPVWWASRFGRLSKPVGQPAI